MLKQLPVALVLCLTLVACNKGKAPPSSPAPERAPVDAPVAPVEAPVFTVKDAAIFDKTWRSACQNDELFGPTRLEVAFIAETLYWTTSFYADPDCRELASDAIVTLPYTTGSDAALVTHVTSDTQMFYTEAAAADARKEGLCGKTDWQPEVRVEVGVLCQTGDAPARNVIMSLAAPDEVLLDIDGQQMRLKQFR
jgi:hypothetical protein